MLAVMKPQRETLPGILQVPRSLLLQGNEYWKKGVERCPTFPRGRTGQHPGLAGNIVEPGLPLPPKWVRGSIRSRSTQPRTGFRPQRRMKSADAIFQANNIGSCRSPARHSLKKDPSGEALRSFSSSFHPDISSDFPAAPSSWQLCFWTCSKIWPPEAASAGDCIFACTRGG